MPLWRSAGLPRAAAVEAAGFEADNRHRLAMGKRHVDIDRHLLAALTAGMPSGSGVALGMDRLIQLALGKESVAEVMAFAAPRC